MNETEIERLMITRDSFKRTFLFTISLIEKYGALNDTFVRNISTYFEQEFWISYWKKEPLRSQKEWLFRWGTCALLIENKRSLYSILNTSLMGVVLSDSIYLIERFKSMRVALYTNDVEGDIAIGIIPILWCLLNGKEVDAKDELDFWKNEIENDQDEEYNDMDLMNYELAEAIYLKDKERIVKVFDLIVSDNENEAIGVYNQWVENKFILLYINLISKIIDLIGVKLEYKHKIVDSDLVEIIPFTPSRTFEDYMSQFVSEKNIHLFTV